MAGDALEAAGPARARRSPGTASAGRPRRRRAAPPPAAGSRRAGSSRWCAPGSGRRRGSVPRRVQSRRARRARRTKRRPAARLDDARAAGRARAARRLRRASSGSGPITRRPPRSQHARLLAGDRGEGPAQVHLVVEVDADDGGDDGLDDVGRVEPPAEAHLEDGDVHPLARGSARRPRPSAPRRRSGALEDARGGRAARPRRGRRAPRSRSRRR